jgi:glycerol-3-phosphate O-acyltransferase
MKDEADHRSAMTDAFGWLPRYVASRLTRHVHLDERAVAQVRAIGESGTIVYVLRNRSLLDYLLINWLLFREGLPRARFANGVSTWWFIPLAERLRRLTRALRKPRFTSRAARVAADRRRAADLVANGEHVLLFLRARSPRLISNRRGRLAAARPGSDYLQEIVRRVTGVERPIHVVPMSLFRGRTFRRQAGRLSAFAYSVHDAPSDLKKLVTYRLNREDLLLTIGKILSLRQFLSAHRSLSEARAARRLTSSLQRELAQEERAVWGPLLLPRAVVAERVFEGPEVRRSIAEIAARRKVPERRVWREARGDFWEIAANFNGLAFGIIETAFHQIWRRAFSGLEVRGLERVVDCVKQHPVVLVPCHRSHFDYMVLSYIFRDNFLSPPHIAAGINLAFWPLSALLRGAGAFFIRRTFEDDELYKLVFHRYLGVMIRQGYTLEFFIEGGRSRTGKILTPKLGMLNGVVRAFLQGVRRDLYLVPVSIHYGRVAEEGAYTEELSGASKPRESFGALLKARSVLKQRHGTVYVSFAEPLSLRATLGERLQRFAREPGDEASEEEQRRFVQKLGFRILRDVNEVAVVGATSLSATVLLSAPPGPRRFDEFASAARTLAQLLRWRGTALTPALERNLGAANFAEVTSFLSSSGLIEVEEAAGARMLSVPQEKRKTLDFYKNNSIHFFLLPSLVANAGLRGLDRADLKDELWWWLELLRWEFALPEREAVAAEAGRVLDYFRAHGAILGEDLSRSDLVLSLAGILENFRESYWIAVRTALHLDGDAVPEAQVIEQMRRRFDAALLLGEVTRLEGASPVAFGNAVSRLVEIGCLARESRKGARDRWIRRGPAFEQLEAIGVRLRDSLERRGGQAPR